MSYPLLSLRRLISLAKCSALLLACSLITVNAAVAQTAYTWVGGNSGSWQDAENWQPMGVPGEDDKALFRNVYASVRLDADVSVAELSIVIHSDIHFVSTTSRFVRIGLLLVDLEDDFQGYGSSVDFDVFIDRVGGVSSRGVVNLPNVRSVGNVAALSVHGRAVSIGGFESIGGIWMESSGVELHSDGGRVGTVTYRNTLAYFAGTLSLTGQSVEIGSIHVKEETGDDWYEDWLDLDFHTAGLEAVPGFDLHIRGNLRCAPQWGITCDLAGVNLIVDGHLALSDWYVPEPLSPYFFDERRDTVIVGGDLLLETGGIVANVIHVSGLVSHGRWRQEPIGIGITESAIFEGPVDLYDVSLIGLGSDPVPIEFRSNTSLLEMAHIIGVQIVARGHVEFTNRSYNPPLEKTVFSVPEGGNLSFGVSPPAVVVGTDSYIESEGTLQVNEYVRVDVPVASTGRLVLPLTNLDQLEQDPERTPRIGSLAAGGTLVGVLEDLAPSLSSTYTLFSFDSIEGSFEEYDLPDLPSEYEWQVTFEDGMALATVVAAEQEIDVIESIQALITLLDDVEVRRGSTDGMLATLRNALRAAERGQDHVVANMLNAFVNMVEAQAGKRISAEDAERLIAAAHTIIESRAREVGRHASHLQNTGISELPYPDALELTSLYPNPASDRATLRLGLPDNAHVRVSVYDMNGRQLGLVLDAGVGEGWHNVHFETSHLAAGVYILRADSDGASATALLTVVK